MFNGDGPLWNMELGKRRAPSKGKADVAGEFITGDAAGLATACCTVAGNANIDDRVAEEEKGVLEEREEEEEELGRAGEDPIGIPERQGAGMGPMALWLLLDDISEGLNAEKN